MRRPGPSIESRLGDRLGELRQRSERLFAALEVECAGRSVAELIRDEGREETPVVTNHAQLIGGLLETPVIGHSKPPYTHHRWTEAFVAEMVDHYRTEYVTVFSEPLEDEPELLAELAAGSSVDWLEPTCRDPLALVSRALPDRIPVQPTTR